MLDSKYSGFAAEGSGDKLQEINQQRADWQRNVLALSMYGVTGKREETLAAIPKALQEHINTAYPAHVCLVRTTLPNGYAQITPRGSTMVYDDDHFALWERGKGSTNANLADGTKITIFFRKPPLREAGLLPRGGIARFYGTAKNLQVRTDLRGDMEPPDRTREER